MRTNALKILSLRKKKKHTTERKYFAYSFSRSKNHHRHEKLLCVLLMEIIDRDVRIGDLANENDCNCARICCYTYRKYKLCFFLQFFAL